MSLSSLVVLQGVFPLLLMAIVVGGDLVQVALLLAFVFVCFAARQQQRANSSDDDGASRTERDAGSRTNTGIPMVYIPDGSMPVHPQNHTIKNRSEVYRHNTSRYPLYDDRRSRRMIGTDFTGAWTNDTRYYHRNEQNGILSLNHVWWLEVEAPIPNVASGPWEPILRVKLDNHLFVAKWEIRLVVEHNTVNDESGENIHTRTTERKLIAFENTNAFQTAQRRIFWPHRRQWIDLSFGIIKVPPPPSSSSWRDENNNRHFRRQWVKFRVFGQNGPRPAAGIHFGHFRLRSHHLLWEKERLLLLCYKGKATVPEIDISDDDSVVDAGNKNNNRCRLEELPREVQRHVAQFLIPPSS